VKTIRRAAAALALASLATVAIKLRGHEGDVPPGGGGWRELSGSDLH